MRRYVPSELVAIHIDKLVISLGPLIKLSIVGFLR